MPRRYKTTLPASTEFLLTRPAKDLSLPRISLIVFERNEGALRLYRRLGYRELDRRRVVPHATLRYRDGDVLLLARET